MKVKISAEHPIIVVTGPESCGKTTLAQRLSSAYNTPLVEEYARAFLSEKVTPYTLTDVLEILKFQNQNESEILQQNASIICDTDQLTIDIWLLEKFNYNLDLPIQNKDQKHYLLCYPDLPWEKDPLRENPIDRDRLFEIYQSRLDHLKCPYTIIKGDRGAVELVF